MDISLSAILQGVDAYRDWKSRILRAAEELTAWLRADDETQQEAEGQVGIFSRDFHNARLKLTIIAEGPGQAAALVNAMLFCADGEALPSVLHDGQACPIALRDALDDGPSLRLLPIATRALDQPLSQLVAQTHHWTERPLTAAGRESFIDALSEAFQAKTITLDESARLGFIAPDLANAAQSMDVPKWRQAIVTLSHPALMGGLTVMIVPGLACLEREPELMAQILAEAQVVLLALANTIGTRQAVLESWQHQLASLNAGQSIQLIVALYDEGAATTRSGTTPSPERFIDPRAAVAKAFGLPSEQIIPVSIDQALTARLQDEPALLQRSRLPWLEQAVTVALLTAEQHRVTECLDDEIGSLARNHYARVSEQIIQVQGHLQDLEMLRGRSKKVLDQLGAQTREQQRHYMKSVEQFQDFRAKLIAAVERCREILAPQAIDTLIREGHQAMVRSWTTRGLRIAMQGLVDALSERMQQVTEETERLRELVKGVYQALHAEHGFEFVPPKIFILTRYHVELELIHQEVQLFRRRPTMAFAEQTHIIERFHEQIAIRARVLFEQIRNNLDPWTRDALLPIAQAINQQKEMMEKRLDNLKRIGESGGSLEQRADVLRGEQQALNRRLTALRNIQAALYQAPMIPEVVDSSAWPRLVAIQG